MRKRIWFKGLVLSVIFALLSTGIMSQVSLMLIPPAYGQINVNNLLNFNITNTGQGNIIVYARIIVSDQNGNSVIEGISNPFKINNGMTPVNGLTYANLNYGNDKYRNVIYKLRGNLPPGQYQVSVTIVSKVNDTEIAEQSSAETVELLHPPELVTPPDKSELETLIPYFTWLPPTPVSPDIQLTYKIKVTEILPHQNALVSALNNSAIFEQAGIPNLFLPYPISAYKLDKDKTYAWQIAVYADGIYIGQTEVWEFSFKKKQLKTDRPADIIQSYAVLKKNTDQSFYLAINKLKFKFDEEYDGGILTIKIFDNNRNELKIDKDKLIKKIGDNKYILDLYDNKEITGGHYYMLEIVNNKKEKYSLNFKYIRKDSE